MSSPSNHDRLWALRHSAEHVMHQAVKELYPQIHLAMGPATDEGFYNDFDPNGITISEADFPKIEQRMQELIDLDLPITQHFVSEKEAREMFADNPYKQEWIDGIVASGEKLSVFWTGEPGKPNSMADFCRGPHVESTGQIKAFKLLSVAGAYWHGDEKNKMLTRIYGTAFESKEELEKYLQQQEEAKNSDHRIIGKNLNLFVFSDLVGKGLPMLTAKGSVIRRELERFITDEELRRGYQHVYTPNLAKVDLYKTSGHYPYYKNTMYPIMKVDEEELILRPMTCPHHFMLDKSQPHSYRELPLRIAELADQHRYEKSGELSGLHRVRLFCLADSHIITPKEKADIVIKEVLDLIDYVNSTFGNQKGVDYRYRLSLGDRSDEKKYYKDDKAWDFAENVLRQVLVDIKAPFYEAPNEAAFYGPKIDVQMKRIGGQEETAFTVQYDFVMPERFDLKFTNESGKEERPIVIHRSSLGAFERVMAFLIEKYKGAFPVWLSPVQAKIIPITDAQHDYANRVGETLAQNGIRFEIDDRSEKMQGKIRDAQLEKTPYMLIIGAREAASEAVAVRQRDGQDLGAIPLAKFVNEVKTQISNRSLNLIK